VSNIGMKRAALVPFALPGPMARRMPLLWWPQLVLLLFGLLLVLLTVFLLLYPSSVDVLTRRDVLAYREAFGFDVGTLKDDVGYQTWGVTRIVAGGAAERAGLRVDDVVHSYHGGTSAIQLLYALQSASAGQPACLTVYNVRDGRLLREALREVCLERPAR
jgi:hypothetical protein